MCNVGIRDLSRLFAHCERFFCEPLRCFFNRFFRHIFRDLPCLFAHRLSFFCLLLYGFGLLRLTARILPELRRPGDIGIGYFSGLFVHCGLFLFHRGRFLSHRGRLLRFRRSALHFRMNGLREQACGGKFLCHNRMRNSRPDSKRRRDSNNNAPLLQFFHFHDKPLRQESHTPPQMYGTIINYL